MNSILREKAFTEKKACKNSEMKINSILKAQHDASRALKLEQASFQTEGKDLESKKNPKDIFQISAFNL